MAVFIDTGRLKKDATKILRKLPKEPAIITRNGTPCAALISVSKNELDDLLWELSPGVQRKIRRGLKEMKSGKGISLQAFAKKYGLS